jgi:hypothetical protein
VAKRRIDTRTSTRIIAGAFCIVRSGQILRAAKASQTGPTRIWVAGQGDLERREQSHPLSWPVHYA